MERAVIRADEVPLRREEFASLNLIGESHAFLGCMRIIRKLAGCHVPVLILGETGTGKELAARAIHYIGLRREYPFIPVNCGGIPDSLVESELFGHARGAFTDAREAHPGLVAEAEGGTLFLDEVEALTPKAQVALLRFLQDQSYRPLGGRRPMEADVRIMAASNEDLVALSRHGAFRQDLLFRLNVISLEMPPLRTRQGDIRLLAEHFVRRLGKEYGMDARWLDPRSFDVLERHGWPGNIRELENLIHREFLLAEGGRILITETHAFGLPQRDAADGSQADRSDEILFRAAKALAVAEFERSFLRRVLSESCGNVSLAARRCGKERRAFGRLLKKHGIDRSHYSDR